jgi:hypothetical protein
MEVGGEGGQGLGILHHLCKFPVNQKVFQSESLKKKSLWLQSRLWLLRGKELGGGRGREEELGCGGHKC